MKPNVFALGDATDLPTSKAGSVTHFEAEVLAENIARFLADEELDTGYDGHANCFIETGFHKALLIDFNYETEPLPGHFPTAFGLPLLRESRLNHLGKLAFQWVYWHALLPGRELPGIGPTMPTAGKKRVPVHAKEEDEMTMTLIADAPVDVDAEGFLTNPEQWNEQIAAGDRRRERHPRADRPALAGRALHARALPRDRQRALDPLARQGVGRPGQGALPALPEGAGQARRQDRRHPQAEGLHLGRSTTMTELLEQPTDRSPPSRRRSRRSRSSISKGSLEGIYPGLIMANGARMEGIEADLFFTFFGLDAIRKDRYEKIKVATVGNPGMHMPTWIGAIPGFSALATRMMKRQMEKIDIPPIPEFIELVADSGVHLYACKATVDMFGLTMDDFVPQVEDIISVGEFYEKAAGGQIVFT